MPTYAITPVPKPRMTRSDKWKKRACVERYFAFCFLIRSSGLTIAASGSRVTFIIAMPKSWSKKKRAAHNGQPHQQRPDIDNYLKAILDALFQEDSHVWDVQATKRWGETAQIIVE